MPITSDPCKISEMTLQIVKMNERLLGVMSPQRLFVLSRCIALKMCLGCGWDHTTEEEMGTLVTCGASSDVVAELGRMQILT